jgi:hypothetical protein
MARFSTLGNPWSVIASVPRCWPRCYAATSGVALNSYPASHFA